MSRIAGKATEDSKGLAMARPDLARRGSQV
jgi:hypothetical protein